MASPRHGRTRRAAGIIVLVVAVLATIATSPPLTTFDFSSGGSIHLDSEHRTAAQRFVVHLGPEALTGHPFVTATLQVDGIRGPSPSLGEGTKPPTPAALGSPGILQPAATGSGAPVQLIVAAIDPAAEASSQSSLSTSPHATGSPPGAAAPTSYGTPTPGPTPWEDDVSSGYGSLPVDCSGPAPCEAGFRLIAQLIDESVSDVTVEWHVSIQLGYSGSAWPSGATAEVRVDPPVSIPGSAPQLEARTAVDRVTLGPDRPAAGRLVEVRIGRAALASGTRPVAAMSLESVDGDYTYPVRWSGSVYPVEPPTSAGAAASSAPSAPPGTTTAPLPDGSDPFASCRPGADCVRRFLIALSWLQDGPAIVDWQLVIRRVGIAQAWVSPAAISARVIDRFDVDPHVAPSTAHFEGVRTTSGDAVHNTGLVFSPTTSSVSRDPLVAVLPIPAVASYVEDPPSNASASLVDDAFLSARVSGPGVVTPPNFNSVRGPAGSLAITANPFTSCHIGQTCPEIEIETIVANNDPSAPAVTFHWALDFVVYSYVDIPVTITAVQGQ